MASTVEMDERVAPHVRLLFQSALVLFVFTVVVGILNGTDLVDFGHETLMTHVHAGTLGWISLCVFAASLWLFGPAESGWTSRVAGWLPLASVVAIAAYVGAFWTTTGIGRPVMGAIALVVMALWFAWVLARWGSVVRSVPRLAVVAAITSLAVGAVLGILLGIELSGEADTLPDGAEGAHPAAMVIGFLIPVGMALAEWVLSPEGVERPADRKGRLQVGLPFVGGVLVMVGILTDITPLVALSLPFEVVGVGILVHRLWPAARAVDWRSRSYARSGALTMVFLAANIALFVYVIGRYEGDVDAAPTRVILALDHVMFIGVMTNSLFGLVAASARRALWPAADHLVVAGTNVGVAGFAVGLLADSAVLKRAATPVMGVAILVAIGVLSARMWSKPVREAAGVVT